jgi:hypothetical protein
MKRIGALVAIVLAAAVAGRAGADEAEEKDRREAEVARQKKEETRRQDDEARKKREEARRKEERERGEEAVKRIEGRKGEIEIKLHRKLDGRFLASPEERAYRRGLEQLDARRWDRAVEAFDEVLRPGTSPAEPDAPAPPAPPLAPKPPTGPVPSPMHIGPKGPLHGLEAPPHRGDAALYWKAYALHKLGRRSEALAAIDSLRREHPQSGWLVQAKMLEVEVKQASGQAPSPESETDDELKLIALNALARTEPERAVPLLEKILNGPAAPGLQERALFVLAQSGSPRAREVTARIARGSSNPDLQMKAVRNLAAMGGRESWDTLADAYRHSADVELKKAILEGLASAGAHDQVAALVQSESNPELLSAAVRSLMAVGGRKGDEAGVADDRLVALYGEKAEPRVRREIVSVLADRGNAHALVTVARKEKDADLKKQIVQRLSQMKDKEATDYLLEILGK